MVQLFPSVEPLPVSQTPGSLLYREGEGKTGRNSDSTGVDDRVVSGGSSEKESRRIKWGQNPNLRVLPTRS